MKGVILAGGKGTRLHPATSLLNKHLLPVGKYPMIHYGIRKLAEAGIKEIILVIGKHSAGRFIDYLGTGSEWGVSLTYRIQEEAGGIAQALSLADGFIRPGENFVVLLGDNLFEDSLKDQLSEYERQGGGARVMLKEVDNPRRYGVPVLLNGQILFIEEKPKTPKSRYSVTGIYMYDYGVFDVIKRIRPSDRGELEITDVNNIYAVEGTLHYGVLNGWWTDAGTHRSIHEAAARLLDIDQ
ncbi:sugar phosphate nucleotidyltransferase [Paenibacillus aurantius]|uniref:Glucose-1-phosphate thymidylyltransferase n=1 Tax=Paenibacillus aurantius TaxID=2918900 RepID=A0AA96RH15_9BACL|nr:sugar phosphate nucleotidyltransferase [Paenibacillus aurantius]WNQ12883.1 sugar phosphate nucleotidyltransferase [Paenibacillus aurantius]